jgi:hypothetical protein
LRRVENVEAQMVALHAPEGLGLRALGTAPSAP